VAEDATSEKLRGGRSKVLSSGEEYTDGSRRSDSESEVRDHLANERTLLSWVRTGVTLISIGLVVERAGALVAGSSVKVGSLSASALFGIGLASLGCLTLILGTVQFFRNRRSISEGNFVPAAAAYVAVVVGGLAFAGAFILYVLLQ
jgi:putative membrane protein